MEDTRHQHSITPQLIPGLPIRGSDSLSLRQNRIALGGLILIILLMLIPPWQATNAMGMTASVGHHFVFSSAPAEQYISPSVDYGRLFLEIIGVVLATIGAVYVTRQPQNRS